MKVKDLRSAISGKSNSDLHILIPSPVEEGVYLPIDDFTIEKAYGKEVVFAPDDLSPSDKCLVLWTSVVLDEEEVEEEPEVNSPEDAASLIAEVMEAEAEEPEEEEEEKPKRKRGRRKKTA